MVETSVFNEVNKEHQVRETFGNEFALCARTCVADVNKWLRANGYELPVEYVFEDGDERGKLTHLSRAQAIHHQFSGQAEIALPKMGRLFPA